jgi:hypothetical protein
MSLQPFRQFGFMNGGRVSGILFFHCMQQGWNFT